MAGMNTLSHHVRDRLVCCHCSRSSAKASALALKMTDMGTRGASSSWNAGNHFSKSFKRGGRRGNNWDLQIQLFLSLHFAEK